MHHYSNLFISLIREYDVIVFLKSYCFPELIFQLPLNQTYLKHTESLTHRQAIYTHV